jgi:hypothetical protein
VMAGIGASLIVINLATCCSGRNMQCSLTPYYLASCVLWSAPTAFVIYLLAFLGRPVADFAWTIRIIGVIVIAVFSCGLCLFVYDTTVTRTVFRWRARINWNTGRVSESTSETDYGYVKCARYACFFQDENQMGSNAPTEEL